MISDWTAVLLVVAFSPFVLIVILHTTGSRESRLAMRLARQVPRWILVAFNLDDLQKPVSELREARSAWLWWVGRVAGWVLASVLSIVRLAAVWALMFE